MLPVENVDAICFIVLSSIILLFDHTNSFFANVGIVTFIDAKNAKKEMLSARLELASQPYKSRILTD